MDTYMDVGWGGKQAYRPPRVFETFLQALSICVCFYQSVLSEVTSLYVLHEFSIC